MIDQVDAALLLDLADGVGDDLVGRPSKREAQEDEHLLAVEGDRADVGLVEPRIRSAASNSSRRVWWATVRG